MRFLDNKRTRFLLIFGAVYLFYSLAFASSDAGAASAEGSGHGGPVLAILIDLIVILLAAKLGGDLFERFKQPAVLGELVFGMIIGNMHLLGFDFFEPFKNDVTLEVLAELGVIILLFEVGLESTVKEMMKVGLASFMVAVFGVIAPFFLGWGVGYLFLPEESIYVHIFIGATLTATSVGITARVLKDIGKIRTREAKIILGAAVIDDILGLIILAVVAGVISAVGAGGGRSWIRHDPLDYTESSDVCSRCGGCRGIAYAAVFQSCFQGKRKRCSSFILTTGLFSDSVFGWKNWSGANSRSICCRTYS